MDIVAIDLGGTHCRFSIVHVGDGPPRLGEVTVMKTAEHASLRLAWKAWAGTIDRPLPRHAAIAVAGPVGTGVLRLTNNPWLIDTDRVADDLGLDDVLVINDFGAVAHAVDVLDHSSFTHIAGPDVPLPGDGVITIVGPGTGLGVAALHRVGGTSHVIETEGGHGDFAPLDAIDDALLARMRTRFRRVSVERIVSGPGLASIHATLCALEGVPSPTRDDKAMWTAALEGSDPLAAAALDRFCLNLGAVAGDIALVQGACAVVIAGGIGERLLGHLPSSGFSARFVAKGRFEARMGTFPVFAVTHPQPGLLGAAAAMAKRHA